MNKNLPKCLCGAEHRWTEVRSEVRVGSPTGATYDQDAYACPICARPALLVEYDIDHDGGNVFLIPQHEPDSGFEGCVSLRLGSVFLWLERVFPWLEQVMLPRWVANKKCKDDTRAAITERWRTYACLEFGLPPDTQIDKNEDANMAQAQAFHDFMETRTKYGPYQYPPGWERVLMPPSLPEGTAGYVRSDAFGAGFIWREVECSKVRAAEAA